MAGMDSVMNCVLDHTFCFIWFQTAVRVGVISVVATALSVMQSYKVSS